MIVRGTGTSAHPFTAEATFHTPVVIPSITLLQPTFSTHTWTCETEFRITNWGYDTDNWQEVTNNDLYFSLVKFQVLSNGVNEFPEFTVPLSDAADGGTRTYNINSSGQWQPETPINDNSDEQTWFVSQSVS